MARKQQRHANRLFPVFVKLEELSVLVVGGGKVALEKLTSILTNAPATHISVVATEINPRLRSFVKGYDVTLSRKAFEAPDLDGHDIVFSAVDDPATTKKVREAARSRRLLLNAADKPGQCDFYLGSIVQKGNLKIAISTNGRSPTIAKRLKEVFNDLLPQELDRILLELGDIRATLRGDFASKVKRLNAMTAELSMKSRPGAKRKQK